MIFHKTQTKVIFLILKLNVNLFILLLFSFSSFFFKFQFIGFIFSCITIYVYTEEDESCKYITTTSTYTRPKDRDSGAKYQPVQLRDSWALPTYVSYTESLDWSSSAQSSSVWHLPAHLRSVMATSPSIYPDFSYFKLRVAILLAASGAWPFTAALVLLELE